MANELERPAAAPEQTVTTTDSGRPVSLLSLQESPISLSTERSPFPSAPAGDSLSYSSTDIYPPGAVRPGDGTRPPAPEGAPPAAADGTRPPAPETAPPAAADGTRPPAPETAPPAAADGTRPPAPETAPPAAADGTRPPAPETATGTDDPYGYHGGRPGDAAGAIKDVTISKNGRSDIVAAATAQKNESLAQMLKRMHPLLSEKQLADEVKAVLKYNKAYGNDLGDGANVGEKDVYLTSIKYRDDQGRITRIEGPTGRVTELQYNGKDMVGFKITGADGKVVEECKKEGNQWKRPNGEKVAENASIDKYGNIMIEHKEGHKLAYLTRGDEVVSCAEDGKIRISKTSRNGQETVAYRYEYGTNGEVTATAEFPGIPERVPLNEEETNVWIQRLQTAGIQVKPVLKRKA